MWQEIIRNAYRTRGDLENKLGLKEEEKLFFTQTLERPRLSMPVQIPPHIVEQIKKTGSDAWRKQAIPTCNEFRFKSYETKDPLFEERYAPYDRLVHRYKDRVLILVSDICALYCRHCFRRTFTQARGRTIKEAELELIVAYLNRHPEIHEVLLSGGDPLMISDEELDKVFTVLSKVEHKIMYRMCTRVPVVLPQRITPGLLSLLKKRRPLWIVVQINHIEELNRDNTQALSSIREQGISILNQSVLLREVNDSLTELIRLCHALVELGIKPYYLFQGDLALGTGHLRVPISNGIKLYQELRQEVSGVALPTYALDLPGGGGKIAISPESVIRKTKSFFYFKNYLGREYAYPVEVEA